MLGDGKVRAMSYKDSFEDILTEFFKIGDSSRFTANMRAKEVVATKGGNKSAMSDGRAEELEDNGESLINRINTDLPEPYIKRICAIISNFTSEYKRKCAVGFFMAQGLTMKFPEEFRLSVDTDDVTRNVENENINNLIAKFNDEQEENLARSIKDLNDYLNSLPDPIAKWYSERSSSLFDPFLTETGNIYKDIRKVYAKNGLELTDEVMNEFKEVVLKYREARIAYEKPGVPRVCNYLLLDNGAFLKTARDALQPIINALPNKIITDLVD